MVDFVRKPRFEGKTATDTGELILGGMNLAGGSLTSEQVLEAREFIRRCPSDMPLDQQRQLYQDKFGDSPIPKEIVDAVVNATDTHEDFNMQLLFQLAQVRGAEMLPWIEPLLKAEESIRYGYAACGLLYIDEDRGVKEVIRLFELCAWTADPARGFAPGWFIEELQELGTPACLEAVKKLEALSRHMVYVRYGVEPEPE